MRDCQDAQEEGEETENRGPAIRLANEAALRADQGQGEGILVDRARKHSGAAARHTIAALGKSLGLWECRCAFRFGGQDIRIAHRIAPARKKPEAGYSAISTLRIRPSK